MNDSEDERVEGAPSAPLESMVIKKRARVEEADDSDEGRDEFSPPSTRELEARARKDLVQFLSTRQVEGREAEAYQIHIRMQKRRNPTPSDRERGRRSEGAGYSVSYSSPEGAILTSKTDVLNSILENRKRSQLAHSRAGDNSPLGRRGGEASTRAEAHAQALARLDELTLPMDIGGIKVLAWGVADSRTGFSSLVQLYPVGYKCEQRVQNASIHRGSSEVTVVCEVGDLDGFPEFCITVKSTGDTVLASSEAAVWRKFNSSNIDATWTPSFFNLRIELLLEGLVGAETDAEYKYHCERGYGSQYVSQADAEQAKVAYLAKSGRERRNQERQKARFLTKEDVERLQIIEVKRLADERELEKKIAVVERDRKDFEREEVKRAKNDSRKGVPAEYRQGAERAGEEKRAPQAAVQEGY
ncbi:hypothetical protein B484DRAFT_169777 [Ochromonadaceae sp. CCMP2298]|nr:hypothetical protein B484DRAFT_169777 [Ochromonadaceae sp. CCMP2298]